MGRFPELTPVRSQATSCGFLPWKPVTACMAAPHHPPCLPLPLWWARGSTTPLSPLQACMAPPPPHCLPLTSCTWVRGCAPPSTTTTPGSHNHAPPPPLLPLPLCTCARVHPLLPARTAVLHHPPSHFPQVGGKALSHHRRPPHLASAGPRLPPSCSRCPIACTRSLLIT